MCIRDSPYPDQIREEYEVREGHSILANISFPHLRPLVEEVFHSLPEPLFFVLQLPLSVQEEQLLRYPRGQAHQEVLYLDNQSPVSYTHLPARPKPDTPAKAAYSKLTSPVLGASP